MICGIGIDIVCVAEIAASIEESGNEFLHRVFTPNEIQYCEDATIRYQRYAARFAAKEAAMKALSTGWDVGVEPHDFEVLNEPSGQPILLIHGEAKRLLEKFGVVKKWVSLAHLPDYAIAQVIFEK